MEKSYDEDLAILMSEARDLFKSANYADSARKYLEAARNQEATRGLAQAEDLYHEAIKNFIRASEENKEKKQFRMSSQNIYYVSYIFKKIGAVDDWRAATNAVIEDLVNAAQEYLLWNEYDRGIVLISTACFFFFSIEEFQSAEQLYKQYIEQIQDDPGFTRAQQVLYAAGHAIKAVKDSDTTALLNAQQLVGAHLKPGLSQIMGELFFPAIDDAMDIVVKNFRSKVKLPKIVPEVKISRDLVLGEPTNVSIIIENEGDGEAFNLIFRLDFPEGIDIIDGGSEITIANLPASHSIEHKLSIRCSQPNEKGVYGLSATLTFYDQLQTKQTMMIGPYDLIFREKSLTKGYEVELADLSSKGLELKNLMRTIEIIPEMATDLVMKFVEDLIKESEGILNNEEFETAQANINTINRVFEIINIVSGNEFLDLVNTQRENFIEERILSVSDNLKEEFEVQKNQLKEDQLLEIENLKQGFEEEKEQLEGKFNIQKENEQRELLEQLKEQQEKEIADVTEELKVEGEKALSEQMEKLDEEKKQALQEQETLLRDEFQKLLSEQQGKKRR
ncbi:MAG: hypothetical protein KAU62_13655 [Candidatus Heimdallarchaeota archaeon]|nr:hypothetical protein [Candidatus Heimdallarchaeota archaeon]MCG3257138.1 hypothetical protein [Candidatus Heimdallarchaeota archaeon]MCK4612198.1 hypothetical protein [Candidatus Heimdallarchaeota archaeon]